MHLLLWLPILALSPLRAAPADAAPARAPAPAAAPGAEACLVCHGDKDLKRTGPAGSEQSLFVDAQAMGSSVHKGMDCGSCHPGITSENHSSGEMRGSGAKVREACLQCHEPDHNLHGNLVKAPGSPSCASCHGTHNIKAAVRQTGGCMSCHEHHFEGALPQGGRLPLGVDLSGIKNSAHGHLDCRACHTNYTDSGHPGGKGSSLRERAKAMNRSCRSCHTAVHNLAEDGVHARLEGTRAGETPKCTDCHGSHDVLRSSQARASIAARCENCHQREHTKFAGSIHGAALFHEGNSDLPTCADCHRAHDTRHAGAARDRSRMHEMCGQCHSDRRRMVRYGLSSAVVTSYLDDFHGVTLRYYSKENRSLRRIATCVDCHGSHDIHSTKGSQATTMRSRLLERCRSCHPKASLSFPDAWLSHWMPSLERAPLVWGIHWFYRILIPLMFVGLGLQVLLHFWRYAMKR